MPYFKLPLAALALGLIGWFFFPAQIGWFSAMLAVQLDRHEILTLGLPARWLTDYRQVMRERYGVTVRPIAGCGVSEAQVQFADSYNRVSIDAINRKYGRDVVTETRHEVASSWKPTPAE